MLTFEFDFGIMMAQTNAFDFNDVFEPQMRQIGDRRKKTRRSDQNTASRSRNQKRYCGTCLKSPTAAIGDFHSFCADDLAADWSFNMQNKTFGATLAELRRSKGMTQLDLADRLGVTDKAVSKWERDLAMPEVENLIKISDLFGVSLDVLLRGEEFTAVETAENFEPTPKPEAMQETAFPPRKIVGTILLCFGAVVALLFTILGDLLSGLIFASPFLLCGAICMIFKRRLGLLCTWAVYFSVYAYMGYASGMNLGSVFSLTWVMLTKLAGVGTQVVTTWVFVIIFALLSVWTVFSFRKEPVSRKKLLIIMISAAVIFVGLNLISLSLSEYFFGSQRLEDSYFLRYFYRIVWSLKDFVESASITTLITALVNWFSNRRRKI